MALLQRGWIVLFVALTLNNVVSQTIDPTSPQCSQIEFYDTTQYECQACSLNSKRDQSGIIFISSYLKIGTSCKCQDGYIVQEDSRFEFSKVCTKCTGVILIFVYKAFIEHLPLI